MLSFAAVKSCLHLYVYMIKILSFLSIKVVSKLWLCHSEVQNNGNNNGIFAKIMITIFNNFLEFHIRLNYNECCYI